MNYDQLNSMITRSTPVSYTSYRHPDGSRTFTRWAPEQTDDGVWHIGGTDVTEGEARRSGFFMDLSKEHAVVVDLTEEDDAMSVISVSSDSEAEDETVPILYMNQLEDPEYDRLMDQQVDEYVDALDAEELNFEVFDDLVEESRAAGSTSSYVMPYEARFPPAIREIHARQLLERAEEEAIDTLLFEGPYIVMDALEGSERAEVIRNARGVMTRNQVSRKLARKSGSYW